MPAKKHDSEMQKTKGLSFDEWKKTIPAKTDEEIGEITYPSEEEEEELDTTFLLEPWEEEHEDE